jgi:hypothetical protein
MVASNRQVAIDGRAPEPNWRQMGGWQAYVRRIYFNSPPFNTTAGLTGNLDLTGFPGGLMIRGAFVIFTQNWTGGSVATATISVGTVASPAAFVAATTVFSGATPITTPVVNAGLTQVPGVFLATPPIGQGTVRVQLITTVGNINTLTAGRADIYLMLSAVNINVK